jgi:hypothetical protein
MKKAQGRILQKKKKKGTRRMRSVVGARLYLVYCVETLLQEELHS